MLKSVAPIWGRLRHLHRPQLFLSHAHAPNGADGVSVGQQLAAYAISASAKTTQGDLPPSSSETRVMLSDAARMIARPTSVDPVNATLLTAGRLARSIPAVAPSTVNTSHEDSASNLPEALLFRAYEVTAPARR